jgi:hypothetical protein
MTIQRIIGWMGMSDKLNQVFTARSDYRARDTEVTEANSKFRAAQLLRFLIYSL